MNKVELSRRSIIAAAAFAVLPVQVAFGQSGAALPFGFIEIGSSGVKASVQRIIKGAADDVDMVPVGEPIPTNNVNPIDPENADLVATAVKTALATLHARGVTDDRIVVVASSGVASNMAAKANIEKAVPPAIAPLELFFVQVSTETEFTFDGVVNKVRLARRRPQVVLLDIGSGNTKGTYVTTAPGKDEVFHTFQMPLGTKSFRQLVQKKLGDDDFATAARKVADTDLRAAVKKMIADAGPVLAQRPRLYLNGGIPWTIATTQNPTNPDRYVPLTSQMVRHFTDLVESDQAKLFQVDTTGITQPKLKKTIADDLKTMSSGSVFTTDEFVAGAELVRVLSEEMRWENKTIFFPRPGKYAWIIGIAYSQFSKNAAIANVVLPTA